VGRGVVVLNKGPASFRLSARIKSFGYAIRGIVHVGATEHNAWLHVGGTIAAIGLSVFFEISAADWRWIILAIGLVWSAEIFNTAVEAICDLTSPEMHPLVSIAKDAGAGAVLIAAISAAFVGFLTWWPYLQV
jgi:diacylglycerol kinase (ATP)